IEVTGIQDTRSETTMRETETRELTVGVRNAYVDTAYAIKAVEEAAEAVNGARRALRDAEKAYDRGEISAGALDDHKTMLTLASANLVQAELAAAQSLAGSAAAAGSSLGTGFYVSGNAQVTESSSMQHLSEANWQGSNLSAANMSIEADVASIIGSDVNAGRLDLNADTILLGAGTNTQSTRSEQDSRQLGVGVSSSGGGSWNASAGYNEASSSSSATQHVNTRLNVGHLDSSSDDLTLRGAVVNANSANITTGTLTIESLQDTQHSENSSMGVNAGIGGSMASFGVPQTGGGGSFGKGDSDSAITGEQSALLVTNGADSQITANHTNLVGGMIANASWEMPEGADENTAPVLVDHGELNFTTGTLTATDLRDYSHSSQTGFGLQTGASSTTISAISERSEERRVGNE